MERKLHEPYSQPFQVKWWKDVLYSLAYLILQLLGLPVFMFSIFVATQTGNPVQTALIIEQYMAYLLFGSGLLVVILGVLFYRKDLYQNWLDFKNKGQWWLIPVVWGATLLANALITSLFFDPGTTAGNEESIRLLVESVFQTSPWAMLALSLLIGVLTPIAEELFFRKILISHLSHVTHLPISIFYALSIVIFIFAHSLGAYPDALLYIPMTLAFSWIYHYYHHNVVASTILHILNNLISVLFMWFALLFT